MAFSPSVEDIKEEITRNVDGYVLSLKIYGSLKLWLERSGIRVFVEKDLPRKDGTPKRPDLLLKTPMSNFVLIDHKYISSSNEITMRRTLEDMDEYFTEFQFDNSSFKPEVVMLCPIKAAQQFMHLQPSPRCIIWGYEVEKKILIEEALGKVKDPSLASLFSPSMSFEVARETLRYKFLRQEPPVPYTADTVYRMLWNLRQDWKQPEFNVSYEILLKQFNTLYPPWINRDVHQLTQGRLNKALELLDRLGFVLWRRGTESIIVDVKRGKRIPDLLNYLIERCARVEQRRRETSRAGRQPARKPPIPRKQPTISLNRWLQPK